MYGDSSYPSNAWRRDPGSFVAMFMDWAAPHINAMVLNAKYVSGGADE